MHAEYLNKTVWCKLGPSSIHGVGVFAIRDIPAGQPITNYQHTDLFEGSVPFLSMTTEEFSRVLPEIQSLVKDRMAWDEGVIEMTGGLLRFISPNRDQLLQSFMNHSDTPNTKGCVALRNIKCGEEITEDFRELIGTPHSLTRQHFAFLYANS